MNNPYLSIVLAVRNDNHGGDFIKRFQNCLNSLFYLNGKYPVDIEIIVVEWNTPDYKPSIAKYTDLRLKPSSTTLKFISVPSSVHKRYKYSDRLPLYQMIAKNVGIKRAKGEFILCTNADIIFSEELFNFLSQKNLSKNKIYRAIRIDIDNKIDFTNYDELLYFAKNNIIRINKKITIRPDKSFDSYLYDNICLYNFLKNRGEYSRDGLFVNACGDFQLIHRDGWALLSGYPEFDRYSFHIDSIFEYQAVLSGFEEIILPDEYCIYHIEHSSGYTPESQNSGEFDRKFPDGFKISYNELLCIIEQIKYSSSKTKIFNTDWGLKDSDVKEIFPNDKETSITFVAVPKPFEGEFEIIQHNAINSWLNLSVNKEVLLLCDNEFESYEFNGNVKYIRELKYTKHGKPDLSSAFSLAKKYSSYENVVYINSDIMLLDDFSRSLTSVSKTIKANWAVIGRRFDANLERKIDFSDIHWWDKVYELKNRSKLHSEDGIDYFIFKRDFLDNHIPDFSIGGTVWDQWVVYKFLNLGYFLIDATDSITAIHQNHNYQSNMTFSDIMHSDMAKENMMLAGGRTFLRNISDCSIILSNNKFLDKESNLINPDEINLDKNIFKDSEYVFCVNKIAEPNLITIFNDFYFKKDIEIALKISLSLPDNPDMLLNSVIIFLEKGTNYSCIVSFLEKINQIGYLKGYNILGIKYKTLTDDAHLKFWQSEEAEKVYNRKVILGLIHFFGLGCKRDFSKGINLIKEQMLFNKKLIRLFFKLYVDYPNRFETKGIIEELKSSNTPEIHYLLGCIYTLGRGVEMSKNNALFHFERAAMLGFPQGYNYMAVNKLFGLSGNVNLNEAKKYLAKGSSFNDSYCNENLALLTKSEKFNDLV